MPFVALAGVRSDDGESGRVSGFASGVVLLRFLVAIVFVSGEDEGDVLLLFKRELPTLALLE